MSVDLISEPKEDDMFYRDDIFIPIIRGSLLDISQMTDSLPENRADILDLRSKEESIVLPIRDSFYHFMHDQVGLAIKAIEKNPGIRIYFNVPDNLHDRIKKSEESGLQFISFFFKALKDAEIAYDLIDLSKYNGIIINNFHVLLDIPTSGNKPEKVFNFYKKYIVNDATVPHRMVYLSRRHITDRSYVNDRAAFTKEAGTLDDHRIDNHDEIDNFFRGLGFEIIIPEIDFKNFEDQIKYFHDVKVLVSATSSGLSNAIFMQPGQTVIEIESPITVIVNETKNDTLSDIIQGPNENSVFQLELHNFYKTISFYKNHLYLAIPNQTKNSEDIIRFISTHDVSNKILFKHNNNIVK